MRFQGRISEWNDQKGYGFVTQNGTNAKSFLHIKQFQTKYRRPVLGDMITYALTLDSKGRYQASDIVLLKKHYRANYKFNKTSAFPIFLAIGYFCFVIQAVIYDRIPNGIPVTITGLSLITFIVYFLDKSAAQKRAWRIQESTLLLLGLFGGWPGATFAQRNFRHKSSKVSFQIQFWATVIINISVVIYLYMLGFNESSLFKLLSF